VGVLPYVTSHHEARRACVITHAVMRHLVRPPNFDATSAKNAAGWMPWAVWLHLLMATFFLGAKDVLPSGIVAENLLYEPRRLHRSHCTCVTLHSQFRPPATDGDQTDAYQRLLDATQSWDPLQLVPKWARWNVFPLGFAAIVILALLLLRNTVGECALPVASVLHARS